MRLTRGLWLVTLAACSGGSHSGTDPGSTGFSGAPGSLDSSGNAGATNNPGGSAEQGFAGAPGGAGSPGANGGVTLTLPQVYPPVRAATPSALIADPTYAAVKIATGLGTARQALEDAVNLGSAIQDRFYSQGPTDLLRIVKDVDDRVSGLDVNTATHACLTAAPTHVTYTLPSGESFDVQLQCMQQYPGPDGSPSGWVAFGFGHALAAPPPSADAGSGDAGTAVASADAGSHGALGADAGSATGAGEDFFLIEGQSGGNGGAYRISANGDVEGWLAVAERTIPSNSQVLMHLRTRKAAGTLELALGGAGVGFCSAHLKTNAHYLFVRGKTNGAPPPPSPDAGSDAGTHGQYCDAPRSGCFDASALGTDLGAESTSCAGIAPGTFELGTEIDASSDPEANVEPANIYSYFSQMPNGIATF
jgi:hypothetical protein